MASEQSAYGGSGPSGPRAGFWIRFGALLIDMVALIIVGIALGLIIGSNAIDSVVSFLIPLAYYTYLEGSGAGQTIGKKLVGIRVIDSNTGEKLGYPRAAVRYLASYISTFVILLGYFWMLWDREKQTWHDKWSGSLVVPVSAYPVEKWPG